MSVCTEKVDDSAEQRITVRRPFLKDFPAILEISNWATCHTSANFKIEPDTLDYWVGLWNGRRENYPWLVAEDNGAVIGFAMALPFKDRCGYAYAAEVSVYVSPDHLGKRIGQALYRQLIPTLAAASSFLDAEIVWRAGEYHLVDKKATNGTFLDGRRIDSAAATSGAAP